MSETSAGLSEQDKRSTLRKRAESVWTWLKHSKYRGGREVVTTKQEEVAETLQVPEGSGYADLIARLKTADNTDETNLTANELTQLYPEILNLIKHLAVSDEIKQQLEDALHAGDKDIISSLASELAGMKEYGAGTKAATMHKWQQKNSLYLKGVLARQLNSHMNSLIRTEDGREPRKLQEIIRIKPEQTAIERDLRDVVAKATANFPGAPANTQPAPVTSPTPQPVQR